MKAILRRAQAYEVLEKYEDALAGMPLLIWSWVLVSRKFTREKCSLILQVILTSNHYVVYS